MLRKRKFSNFTRTSVETVPDEYEPRRQEQHADQFTFTTKAAELKATVLRFYILSSSLIHLFPFLFISLAQETTKTNRSFVT